MVKKYIQIRLPKEVYANLKNYKGKVERDLTIWAGKNMRLTIPKFINALVIKDKEIASILPFNRQELFILAKKKKGERFI